MFQEECPACGGRGCWICNPMHSQRVRNSALLDEAQEIVDAKCITRSARGTVAYTPPDYDHLLAMVAEAIEHGRTRKPPERVPQPTGVRLDYVEFDTHKDGGKPVVEGLFEEAKL